MSQLQFVEKTRNKVASFETKVTVRRSPATLSEFRAARPRWFETVEPHITACSKVTVTFTPLSHTPHGGTTLFSSEKGYDETYFEIETPSGKGAIVDMGSSGSELMAFLPNAGKALIYGCWKKYGRYRGHATAYLRAHCFQPESKAKVEHVCVQRLYDAATGKKVAQ